MSRPATHLLIVAPVLLLLASCENSGQIKGLPKDLPVINLNGSTTTPPHSMAHRDYPFADNGDYKTDWAAEGGMGSGMDYSSWRSSHGSSSSRSSRGSSSKKSSSKSKSSGKGGSYTIKSGDTLGAIARKNGTTVAKIKAANGMKSDFIRAGKMLKIPR